MNIVGKLVWTIFNVLEREDRSFVFSQSTKLQVLVLKLQLGQLHLVNDLFTNLRIDWDVLKSGLICDFLFLIELSRAESLHVGINDDEFATEPVCNVLWRLATALSSVRLIVASLEEENKGASSW